MSFLARIVVVCLGLALALPAFAGSAHAQDRGRKAAAARKPRAAKSAKKAGAAKQAAKPAEAKDEKPAAAESGKNNGAANANANAGTKPAANSGSGSAKGSALANAADDDVKKENGTEVKVLEFSGLDIEGQLKTPQMLYFLNRLRAEFGRPTLPHRSFMPELQRSTKEKSF
jgi:hypothetical protein